MAQKFLTDIELTRGLKDSSGDLGSSGQVLSSTGTGLNWITNAATASVVYQDGFTGDGTTTAFTLANSIDNENKTQVYLDGVYQHKDTYSLSGTTLTFSTAPPNSSDIEVISFASVTADGDILTDSEFSSAGLMKTNGSGVYSIVTDNSTNWNTAYTYSQVGHLPLAGGTLTGNVIFNDDVKANFGTGSDIRIWHNGSNSYFQNLTGNLSIENAANDGNITFVSDDGSGGTATYIRIDGGSEETLFLKKIRLNDNVEAHFGTARDLKIYHDGSHSYIEDTGTGDLRLKGDYVKIIAANNETMLSATQNGAVELYYDNSKKFETTSAGATVTGDLIVSANLTVNGTTTTLNTQTIEVEDNILQLNTTQGSPDTATATTSGISVYRGNGVTQASFIFDDGDDTWDLTNNLVVAGTISSGAITSSASVIASGNSNSFGNTTIAALSATSGTFSASVTAAGNSNSFGTTTFTGDISIPVSNSLYFGGGSHTYIREDIDDRLRFFTGGAEFMRFTEDTSDTINFYADATFAGNIEMGGNSIFTQFIKNNASVRIDIDTDNNQTDRIFVVSKHNAGTELFRVQEDGNVGIGVTSPGHKLDVSGNIRLQGGDRKIIFNNGSVETSLDQMSGGVGGMGTLGRFGVGTVSPNNTFQLLGNMTIGSGATNETPRYMQTGGTLIVQATDANHRIIIRGTQNTTGTVTGNSNNMDFYEYGSYNFYSGVNTGTGARNLALSIDSAGIVKVPGELLIGSYLNIQHASHAFIDNSVGTTYLRNTATGGSGFIFRNSNIGDFEFDNEFAGNIKFNTSNIERMRITSDGKVGIGTTSPAQKLHVDGNIQIGSGNDRNYIKFIRNGGATVGGVAWHTDDAFYVAGHPSFGPGAGNLVRVYGFAGDLRLGDNTNGDVITIDAGTANVGIGTTSPSKNLHVVGANPTIRVEANTTNWAALEVQSADTQSTYIFFRDSGGERARIQTTSSNDLRFSTGGGGVLGILQDSSGNVGIGASNPGAKLDVGGDLRVGNVGSTSSTTNHETVLRVKGKNNYSDGTTWYGDYGQIILHADTNMTGSARRYMITSALNNNKFAIVRSVDGNTDPLVNSTSGGDAVNSGTADFVIDNSGRIGIGTTAPSQKLHVKGDSAILYTEATGSNQNSSIWFRSNVGGTVADRFEIGTNIGNGADLEIYSRQDSATRFLIESGTGNVGIGTTGPGYKLHVYGDFHAAGAAYLTATNSSYTNDGLYNSNARPSVVNTPGGQKILFGYKDNGAGGYFPRIGFRQDYNSVNSPNTTSAKTSIGLESDGRMSFKVGASNAVEALNIKPAGYVGIGTTSPAYKLHISEATDRSLSSSQAQMRIEGNGYGAFFALNTDSFQIGQNSNSRDLTFHSGASSASILERMRIKSHGDVVIGGTSTQNARTVSFDVGTNNIVFDNCTTSGAGNGAEFQTFRRNNGTNSVQIGSIVMNGTSGVTYATSSDYRLKENVVELTNALDRVDQLKPSRFNFISDESRTIDGFLAHEVQDIVPEAIVGTKDEVDEDGNPKYQSIDQSKLVPLLVGAIKELKAEIEQLKTQINGTN